MGTALCSVCEHELSLDPRKGAGSVASMPAVLPKGPDLAPANVPAAPAAPGGAPAPLRRPSALAMMAMRSNPPPKSAPGQGPQSVSSQAQAASAQAAVAPGAIGSPRAPSFDRPRTGDNTSDFEK